MDLMNREEVLDNAFNSGSGRRARRVRKTRRGGLSSNQFYCTNCNHYVLSEDGYLLSNYCQYCWLQNGRLKRR